MHADHQVACTCSNKRCGRAASNTGGSNGATMRYTPVPHAGRKSDSPWLHLLPSQQEASFARQKACMDISSIFDNMHELGCRSLTGLSGHAFTCQAAVYLKLTHPSCSTSHCSYTVLNPVGSRLRRASTPTRVSTLLRTCWSPLRSSSPGSPTLTCGRWPALSPSRNWEVGSFPAIDAALAQAPCIHSFLLTTLKKSCWAIVCAGEVYGLQNQLPGVVASAPEKACHGRLGDV